MSLSLHGESGVQGLRFETDLLTSSGLAMLGVQGPERFTFRG